MYGASRDSQPAGVDVVALERVVVEVIVICRVRDVRLQLAEIPVQSPGYDALVLHGVRNRVCLENPRGRFQDAVPYGFLFFLDGPQGVGSRHLELCELLLVVFFLLFFGQGCVPRVELGLGLGGGVGYIYGVQLVPERGVEKGFKGVPRAEAPLGERGVRDLEDVLIQAVRHGVAPG